MIRRSLLPRWKLPPPVGDVARLVARVPEDIGPRHPVGPREDEVAAAWRGVARPRAKPPGAAPAPRRSKQEK